MDKSKKIADVVNGCSPRHLLALPHEDREGLYNVVVKLTLLIVTCSEVCVGSVPAKSTIQQGWSQKVPRVQKRGT